VRLTTTNTNVQIDLQSILTHEAGHFLGLAHSLVNDATMYPSYNKGDVSFRDLSQDDQQGVCAIYPADRPGLPACDPTAASKGSLGYSPLCGGDAVAYPADDSSSGGCHCSVAGRGDPGAWASGVGTLAALGVAGGRRRRRPGRA
jgi:MYXO-CTERM domain-containing protein